MGAGCHLPKKREVRTGRAIPKKKHTVGQQTFVSVQHCMKGLVDDWFIFGGDADHCITSHLPVSQRIAELFDLYPGRGRFSKPTQIAAIKFLIDGVMPALLAHEFCRPFIGHVSQHEIQEGVTGISRDNGPKFGMPVFQKVNQRGGIGAVTVISGIMQHWYCWRPDMGYFVDHPRPDQPIERNASIPHQGADFQRIGRPWPANQSVSMFHS
jgi:hypothetical protein